MFISAGLLILFKVFLLLIEETRLTKRDKTQIPDFTSPFIVFPHILIFSLKVFFISSNLYDLL